MSIAKKKFEKEIAMNSKKNPKAFWAHVRRSLKTKTGIAPLLKDNNDKLSIRFSDKDKANILQNQFASVFIHEPPGDVPSLPTYTEFSTNYVKVTTEMVHEELSNLNINKSVGPDEIHPRILNELADELSKPIALLLNKSLEVG